MLELALHLLVSEQVLFRLLLLALALNLFKNPASYDLCVILLIHFFYDLPPHLLFDDPFLKSLDHFLNILLGLINILVFDHGFD